MRIKKQELSIKDRNGIGYHELSMDKVKIKSFKDLIAWKKGHAVVLSVYQETNKFPKDELFGLTTQMRRCSVSITSNIAEGFSRKTYKDKSQFYSVALGSVTELQNQIQIAYDIGLLQKETFNKLDWSLVEVHKIINGLIKSSKIAVRA